MVTEIIFRDGRKFLVSDCMANSALRYFERMYEVTAQYHDQLDRYEARMRAELEERELEEAEKIRQMELAPALRFDGGEVVEIGYTGNRDIPF
jgi:hypothetical protein